MTMIRESVRCRRGLTLREADEHLESLHARNLRPSYIEARARLLRRLERTIDDPVNASLVDLRAYLNRDLAAGSRATEIAHLRGFYQWLLLEEHIAADPTLRLARPKVPAGQPRPIVSGDLARALDEATPVIRQMLYLAAYAGLRACEIAPLRGEQVMLSANPPILVILEGKGGVPGSVPISPILGEALSEAPAHGYLFARLDGKPGHLSRYRICQLCNGFLHGLGIDATLHQARHWFGTETYRATRDLRVTQKLMRHKSSKDTDRYTYVADDEGVAAVGQLPRLS